MSLEEALNRNTEMMERLCSILGAVPFRADPPKGGLTGKSAAQRAEEEVAAEKKSDAKSTDTTSGKPSAPTGESSSPALDYAKDVKPITIRLSQEKGREITIGVLSRFGVKSAQDLDAAQWADYIAHCEKVLAGGEV